MRIFSEELRNIILSHFQLQHASAEKQEKILESFDQLTSEVVVNTILDSLSDESSLVFLQLCEVGKDVQALDYARSKIPDLDKKINQEIAKTITELGE